MISPPPALPKEAAAPPRYLMALLMFISLAVYGRVCGHAFLSWDDPQNVVSNRRVDPPTWQGVAESWRHSYRGRYTPVAYTFFAAEAAVSHRLADTVAASLNPAVFHAGSLLLHVLCVLLVYVILRHLLHGQDSESAAAGRAGWYAVDGAALIGALWFSLHPLQVESVAWISETRGLLCAMFSLLAIWQYLHCGQASGPKSAVARYLFATFCFGLALLSKPAAVAVPLLAAALDMGLLRRPLRQTLLNLAPWLALAAAVALATHRLQPGASSPAMPSLWASPLLAGKAILFYGMKTLVPWPLSTDYRDTPQWMMQQAWLPLAALAPLGLLGALAVGKARHIALTCAAVFVLWLLPILGRATFDFQWISTVADRYAYLALLGPALGLAWLVKHYWRPWVVVAAVAVLGLYAVLSSMQVSYWHDTGALFAHVLEVNPRSAVARYHLGVLLVQNGKHVEATDQFRKALAQRPDLVEIHLALGSALVAADDNRAAQDVLRGAAERFPHSSTVRNALAAVLVRLEAGDEAERQYREVLRIQPDNVDAHLGLGMLQYRKHALAGAQEHFHHVLQTAPDNGEAHVGLGVVLEATGDREAARSQYLAALKIQPHLAMAHFNLGNLLLREPARLTEAVAHYEESLLANPNYAEGYVNLGIALGRQGKTCAAIEMQRAALRLNPRLIEARVQLGLVLAANGEREEAAAALRTALQQVPADSQRAGQIRALMGDAKRASP
jgi:tetratricopeptide (TPR) repeat protein